MISQEIQSLVGQLNAGGASSAMPQNAIFEYSVYSLLSYNILIIIACLVNIFEGENDGNLSVSLVTIGIISQYMLVAYGAAHTWTTLASIADTLQYAAPFFVLLLMVIVLNTAFGIFLIHRIRRS